MSSTTQVSEGIKFPLADGIYFGLPEEVYFADPALSRSSFKQLIESPYEYWLDSDMNPNWKPRVENKQGVLGAAKVLGKAFHALLFEPAEFNRRFQVIPGDTYDHSRATIDAVQYRLMKEAIAVIHNLPDSDVFMQRGYAEVTVVWTDATTGLRFKTRHDYFTIFATIDYKTTRSLNDDQLRYDLKRYGYLMQDWFYLEARREIRKLILARKAGVWGCDDDAFIHAFLKEPEDFFVFIFQKKDVPFAARTMKLDEESIDKGRVDCERAVDIYLANKKRYGTKMWPGGANGLEEFSAVYGSSSY